jgi:hypothetical protein
VNLPALREIGFKANRRLQGVQRLDHDRSSESATCIPLPTPPLPTKAPASQGFALASNVAMPFCPRC